jgi:hypothetical protein
VTGHVRYGRPGQMANLEGAVGDDGVLLVTLETRWVDVGLVMSGNGYRQKMPDSIPVEAGVYRLLAESVGKTYVGEAESLSRRLRNYENAGWRPGIKSATNRHVQSWLHDMNQNGFPVRVLVCTEAHLTGSDGSRNPVRMSGKQGKYGRTMVESALIECHPNLEHINKRSR